MCGGENSSDHFGLPPLCVQGTHGRGQHPLLHEAARVHQAGGKEETVKRTLSHACAVSGGSPVLRQDMGCIIDVLRRGEERGEE